MKFKKVRKPRSLKADGTESMDMCEGCKAFGCDPMGMSPAYQLKARKRQQEGKCISCGSLVEECSCKSSLSAKPQFISNRQRELYITNFYKKKIEVRKKAFEKRKALSENS